MIGTSLSFCVSDIIRGLYSVEDVEKIFAGTAFHSCEEAIESYSSRYWSENPEFAAKICRELWSSKRIVQTRFIGGIVAAPYAGEYWYESMKHMFSVQEKVGYYSFCDVVRAL